MVLEKLQKYQQNQQKRQAQNRAKDAISELALITSPICPFHGAKWTHMVPAEKDVRGHLACKCCGPTDLKESLASCAHEGCKTM